jgi:hypothetical protein
MGVVMSNIKWIDGIAINLDLVKIISPIPIEIANPKCTRKINIRFFITLEDDRDDKTIYFDGKLCYANYREAEARIHQILKDQNSDKIGI